MLQIEFKSFKSIVKMLRGVTTCSASMLLLLSCFFLDSLTGSPALAQSSVLDSGSSFRSGHNLTVAMGIQQSRWSLDLAALEKPLTTERFNFLTTISYGFHFRVFQRMGLVIGTALHGILDRTSQDGFEPKFGVLLPSILSGVALSLGSQSRLLLLGELGASWYPYSLWKVRGTKNEFEGGVFDQMSLTSQLDLGLHNSNVISLIAGWRLAAENFLGQPVGLVVDSNSFPASRHEGWFVALGITKQVTETLTGGQGGF